MITEEARELLKCGAQAGLDEAIEKCHIQDLVALNALFMSWQPGESLVEVVEVVFPTTGHRNVSPEGGIE